MNKITCICLGVRSMQRALKFYREGLGYGRIVKTITHRYAFSIRWEPI